MKESKENFLIFFCDFFSSRIIVVVMVLRYNSIKLTTVIRASRILRKLLDNLGTFFIHISFLPVTKTTKLPLARGNTGETAHTLHSKVSKKSITCIKSCEKITIRWKNNEFLNNMYKMKSVKRRVTEFELLLSILGHTSLTRIKFQHTRHTLHAIGASSAAVDRSLLSSTGELIVRLSVTFKILKCFGAILNSKQSFLILPNI